MARDGICSRTPFRLVYIKGLSFEYSVVCEILSGLVSRGQAGIFLSEI